MNINCQDNALRVAMFTNDTGRSTAGVGVSVCCILENLLQRILEQNHQSHLEYKFYLHNDYRFTSKDKMVKKDELETFGRLECFGINERTWINTDDIYFWFKDPTEKVDEQTTLSADDRLPDGWLQEMLSVNDVPVIARYISVKAYFNLFVELGLQPEIVDLADFKYRNKPEHMLKSLLETFITEIQPPPTRNTILLAMQECDMDTESLITAFNATEGTS